MKKTRFTVEHMRPLTADTVEMVLSGDTSAITAPGQFVNLALEGKFLRRPISVCSWTEGGLLLLIKVVGAGTRALADSPPGTVLDVLVGLGNGFSLSALPPERDRVVLAGGGIGIAPLYGLAKILLAEGIRPLAALGFRTSGDAYYLEEFAALGCDLMVSTEDGSLGAKGTVTDLLRRRPERTYVLCCGPAPMLRAVCALPHLTGGQCSLEARMGCGFGACMGCSIPTRNGYRRVCRDGPVFAWEDLLWTAQEKPDTEKRLTEPDPEERPTEPDAGERPTEPNAGECPTEPDAEEYHGTAQSAEGREV